MERFLESLENLTYEMLISLSSPPCLASYARPYSAFMPCANAKFVFVLSFILYVNTCLNVSPPPPVTRSEPLMKHYQMGEMNILRLTLLCLCSIVFILSKIDLNIRYIPFNTRLNTLTWNWNCSSLDIANALSIVPWYSSKPGTRSHEHFCGGPSFLL